jgi:ribosomal protein L16/L10AE
MLNIPLLNKQKFKTSKLFKQKTLAKNTFLSPYSLVIGLKESVCINRNQVLILNQFLSKLTRKRCNILFKNIFFIPFTKKSIGTRMGKGKGAFFGWCFTLKKGSILVEMEFTQKNLFNKKFKKKLKAILPCQIYQTKCMF